MKGAIFDILFVTLYILQAGLSNIHVSAQPMPCGPSAMTACESYLYFFAAQAQESINQVAVNFNVQTTDIGHAPPGPNGISTDYMIPANCSCRQAQNQLLATVVFYPTAQDEGGNYTAILEDSYNNLAYLSWNDSTGVPALIEDSPVEVDLMCGCPILAVQKNFIVTYVVQRGDTVKSLAAKFQTDLGYIQAINDLQDIDVIKYGQNLYIPTNYRPSLVQSSKGPKSSSGINIGVVIGVAGGGVALIAVLVVVLIICCRRQARNRWSSGELGAKSNNSARHLPIAHPCHLPPGHSAKPSRWRNLLNYGQKCKVTTIVKRSLTLNREAKNVFDKEKPIIFKYEDVITATNGFHETQLLGKGSFGTVYFGRLRGQDVAIKEMQATKSKEFFAELNVLCQAHHTNLIELIGYSGGDESLFLVYEFAENGALNEHLHESARKGLPHLSWVSRVQIALDAARGLEYIHDHTKAKYVHRDIKTSNILLDGSFRAMVSDFGFAKLVEQINNETGTVSKIKGTDGYIAPEYMQSGTTTSKCDVYAFGVVLFEIITGRVAVERTPNSPVRKSLVSTMMSVLQTTDSNDDLVEKNFKLYVDRRLEDCYPVPYAFQMAKLAEACADYEPANRPKMSQVVLTLSQIVLHSVEWEASLAGTSAIFSGLMQGR